MHFSFRLAIILGIVAALNVGCSDERKENIGKGFRIREPAGGTPTAPALPTPTPAGSTTPAPTPNPAPVSDVRAEQDKCTPKKEGKSYLQSDCGSGLVCAPNINDVSTGTCRVSCGQLEKGKTKKVEGTCQDGRTCQLSTSLTLDELGAFCLPQQKKRDGTCFAMGDKDACSNGRICAVTEVKKGKKDQVVASNFVCRDACAFGTPKAADSCSSGEKCLAYPYESTMQNTDAGEPVMCTEAKCKGDLKDCECDKSNGFQCTALIPGMIAFCDRPAGICTTPVGFAAASQFEGGRFSGEGCNETKGHAFCNNALFEGVKDAGEATCMTVSEKTGDGICFAFCSAPAIDMDGDGQLKGPELGKKFGCPADYTCNKELGRMFGIVASVGDKEAASGKKVCDPAKCEVGKPCPSECGIGEAECLSYETKAGGQISFCGAPLGNCELAITPK